MFRKCSQLHTDLLAVEVAAEAAEAAEAVGAVEEGVGAVEEGVGAEEAAGIPAPL